MYECSVFYVNNCMFKNNLINYRNKYKDCYA